MYVSLLSLRHCLCDLTRLHSECQKKGWAYTGAYASLRERTPIAIFHSCPKLLNLCKSLRKLTQTTVITICLGEFVEPRQDLIQAPPRNARVEWGRGQAKNWFDKGAYAELTRAYSGNRLPSARREGWAYGAYAGLMQTRRAYVSLWAPSKTYKFPKCDYTTPVKHKYARSSSYATGTRPRPS